ncbi:MAG: hypothetical protein ACXW03_01220 [Methylobacter sp.]
MIASKVIRIPYAHITRADYKDTKPLLGSENVIFPEVNSLEARALRCLINSDQMSHRGFDFVSHSYRLSSYIGALRAKGWPIVNHDHVAITGDIVPRKAKYTDYELFAEFTPELLERIKAFCKAIDEFEARAAATAPAEKAHT